MSKKNGTRSAFELAKRTAQPPKVSGGPAEPDAVVIAYAHDSKVSYSWHHSIIELVAFDVAHAGRVMRGGWLAMKCGTNGLTEARNMAVEQFLEENQAPWLLWIDTDMGFSYDALEALRQVADPVERPVVGGLCFTQRELESDGKGGWSTAPTPTIFDWAQVGDEKGYAVRWNYPVNSVVRCSATGAAFVLIHRSVFERIKEKFGPIWYDRVRNPSMGRLMGEDMSFCVRATALEIPIHVHTGVRVTHHKEVWIGESDYWRERLIDTPALAQPTAVIVPTINRPEAAEPFMRSLRSTTGAGRAYALMVEGDPSESAWREAGAEILFSEREGWSPKCNAGYRQTSEPWLFFTGDDVKFHPGWLEQAQVAAHVHQASVVGSNDLGNPRVTSGQHAVHFLVKRSYVDEMGASWDGPGVVCHEGYRVWYPDDEVVTAAKQRGVWAMALGSRVEHLHPLWGKGDEKSNALPDEEAVKADRALFLRRRRANRSERERVAAEATS